MKLLNKHICTHLFIFLTFASFSCRQEKLDVFNKDSDEISKNQEIALIEYIKSLGFKDQDIQSVGNNIIVEGDIVFPKNMNIPESGSAKINQYYGGNAHLVDYPYRDNVRVKIDPSMVSGVNMTPEINAAIAQWNGIANSRIRFNLVASGSYDILIKDASLGTGTCGQALLPSGGLPGYLVEIHKSYIASNSFDQRQRTIAHELGHCIGFDHTNNPLLTSLNVPNAGGTDSFSLMNGNQCGIGATVLSDKDKYATFNLYPSVAVNDKISYDFYSSGSGSGTIKARPGSLVTLSFSAYGPAGTSLVFNLSGAPLSGGNTVSLTSGYTTRTFTMPTSGYVDWNGNFYQSGGSGTGHISGQN